MQKSNKNEVLSKSLTIGQDLLGVNDYNRNVVDAYYTNGFNGRKAVLEFSPEMSLNSASATFNHIFANEKNKAYIAEKRQALKELTNIENEHILRELINWAYSDATSFIGLTKEEVKELPNDIKRSIQTIKIKTRTYYDKQIKEEVTEEQLEIKMVDKTKAVEMINKHIGFYSEDNRQKGSNINILQVLQDSNPEVLNGLLQAMQQNTIDQ